MTGITSVPLPPGFEWKPLLRCVNRLGDDWVNRTDRAQFIRLLTVGRRKILIRCAPKADRMAIRLTTFDRQTAPAETKAEIRRLVSHIFSLDLEWPRIRRHLATDPTLAPYLNKVCEFRPFRAASLFEALIDSIVGQQVNVTFATKLRNRLVEEFGASARHDGETYHAFPTPSRLGKATVSLLREMQLSQRKAEYILGVARRFERAFQLNGCGESDIARLTALRGIGPWSAAYALMQGGGALDVVPAGDVGLQAKLQRLHKLDRRPDDPAIRALAETWRPYRSIASYFIWYAIPGRDASDDA
jgi:DNA-3-methyladenine glycosylase II